MNPSLESLKSGVTAFWGENLDFFYIFLSEGFKFYGIAVKRWDISI